MHKKRPRCCRLVLEARQVVVTYTFSRGESPRRDGWSRAWTNADTLTAKSNAMASGHSTRRGNLFCIRQLDGRMTRLLSHLKTII